MAHISSDVQYAVELRQVSKIYPGTPPVAALSEVSFSVVHGEFVGIVGASGSGKSTLLHVVGTLTRPTTGDVFIDGINTDGLSDRGLSGLRAKRIGFVFQEFFLLPGFWRSESVVGLVPKAIGIVQTAHLGEQQSFHFGQFIGVSRVLGEVGQQGILLAVLGNKLIRVLGQVEQLSLPHGAVQDIVLD